MNDPSPEADRSDGYLDLVSDCAFHLANKIPIDSTYKQRSFARNGGGGGAEDDEQHRSISLQNFVPANMKIQTIWITLISNWIVSSVV